MAEDKELAQGDTEQQQQAGQVAAANGAGNGDGKPLANGTDETAAAAAAGAGDAAANAKGAEKMENDEGGDGSGDAVPKENGGEKEPDQQAPASPDQQQQQQQQQPQLPPAKDMRAIVLGGYGGIHKVKSARKPEPTELADTEVLLKVKACGVNYHDIMARQGSLDSPSKPPFILGFECAGDVVQVGENVKDFKVGDKVVALPDHKAWAELVAVPAQYVYKLPFGMSYNDAAAITMNYTVAYFLLFEIANLTPGKSILLHGVSGGVGQAITRLAKTVPNTTIFGVCSKSKHEILKYSESSKYIDHLLEKGTDFSAAVKKESPDGVDIVLDSLYGEECRRGYALLKPLGRYILFGLGSAGDSRIFSVPRLWWQVDKVAPVKLYEDNKNLCGFNLRQLLYHGQHDLVRKVVNQVFQLWSEKIVEPVIDSTYALEDAAEALLKLQERKNIGKLLLDLSLEPKPKPATPAKGKGKDKKNTNNQEEKKSPSTESEDAEKPKEPELTNGTSEEKSDNDSKEKESS